ncbi:histidine kinase [Streptomyces sp. RFCAC02]|uniref:sensor histidine kinase n=1 Tax=Streptomyces sp. RFCAC02 TaxID=2499143 RepID=UPI001F10986B|nr:histidine kinase [Streptomyces sp. RFCAC02]
MRIRPFAVDALIAGALTAVAVLLGHESPSQGQPELDAPAYALVALANFSVILRSRYPVSVCLFIHAAWAVYIGLGYWPVVSTFGPMLATYTVAALRTTRVSIACAALLGVTWLYAGAVSGTDSPPSVVGQAVVFPAVLWRFGITARRSAELARRLRAEQADRARREVAEERDRIARELHDVVAHHLSVVSVQAGLARFVLSTDLPTARTAIDTIEATSSEALDELRRMLHVLRTDESRDTGTAGGDPSPPMPGLARLAETVERVRAAGVRVRLGVEGEPRPLAPGVELCAYRVAQEALTNVIKHARHARATVELRYEPHRLTLTVTDDGAGPATPRPPGAPGGTA